MIDGYSSAVKRYDPSIADGDGWEITDSVEVRRYGDASPCMKECEVGDYVKYADYDALRAELLALRDWQRRVLESNNE